MPHIGCLWQPLSYPWASSILVLEYKYFLSSLRLHAWLAQAGYRYLHFWLVCIYPEKMYACFASTHTLYRLSILSVCTIFVQPNFSCQMTKTPGEAGAVLHKPLLLMYSLVHSVSRWSFFSKSLKCVNFKTVKVRELKFLKMFTSNQMLCVNYHVSCFLCHLLHVFFFKIKRLS